VMTRDCYYLAPANGRPAFSVLTGSVVGNESRSRLASDLGMAQIRAIR
jgi:hypothetical protein